MADEKNDKDKKKDKDDGDDKDELPPALVKMVKRIMADEKEAADADKGKSERPWYAQFLRDDE